MLGMLGITPSSTAESDLKRRGPVGRRLFSFANDLLKIRNQKLRKLGVFL